MGTRERRMLEEVLSICPDAEPDKVLADLLHTNSVELTINRIFEGTLLLGVTQPNEEQAPAAALPDPVMDFAAFHNSSPLAALHSSPLPTLHSSPRRSPSPVASPTQPDPVASPTQPDPVDSPTQKDPVEPDALPPTVFLSSQPSPPPEPSPIKNTLPKSPQLTQKQSLIDISSSLDNVSSLIELSSDEDEPKRPAMETTLKKTPSPVKRPMEDDISPPAKARRLTPPQPKERQRLLQHEKDDEEEQQHVRNITTPIKKRATSIDLSSSDSEDLPAATIALSQPSLTKTTSSSSSTSQIVMPKLLTMDDVNAKIMNGQTDTEDDSPNSKKPKKQNRKKTAEEKAAERAQKTLKKLESGANGKVLKENEKEALRLAREQKKAEAELLKQHRRKMREINKRKSTEDCLKEMCITLDTIMISKPGGADLLLEVQLLGMEVQLVQQPMQSSMTLKRKIKPNRLSQDGVGDVGDDVPMIEKDEVWVIIRLTAKELTDLLIQGHHAGEFVLRANQHFGVDKIPFFLLEGMSAYVRNVKLQEKRDFDAIARGLPVTAPETRLVDLKTMLEELVLLQTTGQCCLFQTEGIKETATAIKRICESISEFPYRKVQDFDFFANTTFRCVNATESWLAMLQLIQGVSEHTARAVVGRYPTLQSLLRAYQQAPTKQDAQKLLTDIHVDHMINSRTSTKKIAFGLSSKIHAVFTETNPSRVIQ